MVQSDERHGRNLREASWWENSHKKQPHNLITRVLSLFTMHEHIWKAEGTFTFNCFLLKRPVASAAIAVVLKRLIHVASKLLLLWMAFLYFCILCSFEFLTSLSALKHFWPTAMLPSSSPFIYEWVVKHDIKMQNAQAEKFLKILQIWPFGHVLSDHTRWSFFSWPL